MLGVAKASADLIPGPDAIGLVEERLRHAKGILIGPGSLVLLLVSWILTREVLCRSTRLGVKDNCLVAGAFAEGAREVGPCVALGSLRDMPVLVFAQALVRIRDQHVLTDQGLVIELLEALVLLSLAIAAIVLFGLPLPKQL